jgi:recombination associated protein RdgC
MGALNGSLSTTKFYVRGELPKNLRRAFMERIALRIFRPLEPNEEAEERAGWCAIGQPFDLDLSADKVFNDTYLTLGLRLDRYRFPARVVQAELARASQAALQKSGHERLSRAQKAELKQRVMSGLRRKYLPSMQAVDVVWHLDAGELYFWSQSRGMIERLSALFELCFALGLVENSPFSAAERLLPAQRRAQLEQLEHTPFHAQALDGPG